MKVLMTLIVFATLATACTKKEEASAPAPEAAPEAPAEVPAAADTVTTTTL